MGLFSGLFGGSSPSGPAPVDTANNFGALPNAQNLFSTFAPSTPPFSRVAGFTPNQQAGWDASLAGAASQVPAAQNALGIANQYGGGFQNYLGQAGGLNPMLMQLIQQGNQLLGRNFQQATRPGINQGAVGVGGFGGSRHGITEGIAQQGLGDAMQRQTTQLLGSGWSEGQRNLANAWNQAPGMAQLQMNAQALPGNAMMGFGQALGGVGGQQQGMNQLRLAEMGQDWQTLQQAPLTALQNYSNLVNQAAGQGSTSTGPNPNYMNPLQSALGGALAGSSIYNNIFGGGGGTPPIR